jgi:hypothetical protein
LCVNKSQFVPVIFEPPCIYSSPNIIRGIKSGRMRWVGHMACRVLGGNLRKRDHLEDSGTDGRVIIRCVLKKWVGRDMNWIDLAQDGDMWRALVNAVMNLRTAYTSGNYLTS